MAWSYLAALLDGEFHKVMDAQAWADFKPMMFQIIDKKGKFILMIVLKCGCRLPLFYEVVVAHMEDETKRDVLTCRPVWPKDWDTACPFQALPQSALGQTVLEFRTEWHHHEVEDALRRLGVQKVEAA